ncbi:MAG: FHA domain-containing protein [Candidatus Eremiobacteraeota bacterium]|nr:FHA domain-containing protein [Candidatus Eremiobacteraeota bacterium]
MQCPKCGLENIHGAQFCEDCGTLLRTREVSPVSAPPPPPSHYQQPPQQYAPPPPPPPHYDSPPQAGRFAPPTVLVTPPAFKCPKCGRENVVTAVYCGGCSISLTGRGGIPDSPKCFGKLTPLGGGAEFYLDRDKILIGRKSEGDGIFPEIDMGLIDTNAGVSRRHGQIIKDDEHCYVEDLGSSNGTFINDIRVPEGVQNPIKDGDTLRFGGYSFIFRKTR